MSERIAIIDDDEEAIELAKWEISDAGYDPFLIEDPITNINALIDSLSGSTFGVLCDHRLGFGGKANFFGAEIVAGCYDRKLPAILVTQFVHIDNATSIRKWRSKIPALIDRDKIGAVAIKAGFDKCKRELLGEISSDRVAYEAIVRIIQIDNSRTEKTVLAIVPTWNPYDVIEFPLSIIPSNISETIEQNTRLLAKVNIGATKFEDLFFTDFKVPPRPIDE